MDELWRFRTESIDDLIEFLGLSQRDLAGVAMVDESAVSMWVRGKRVPCLGQLVKISSGTGVPLSCFTYIEPVPFVNPRVCPYVDPKLLTYYAISRVLEGGVSLKQLAKELGKSPRHLKRLEQGQDRRFEPFSQFVVASGMNLTTILLDAKAWLDSRGMY